MQQMPQQVVSPYDPAVARRNRITLVVLLAIVGSLFAATIINREGVYHAMTNNKSAHGKR
jgi:hypothetical protein